MTPLIQVIIQIALMFMIGLLIPDVPGCHRPDPQRPPSGH